MSSTSSTSSPVQMTPADELQRLAMRQTFWILAGGLVGAFAAFFFAVLMFHSSSDASKTIPAVLGVLFTVIGTILGHLQGGASGQAAASSAHKESESLRAQIRAYESALPQEATKQVRVDHPSAFPDEPRH